jgi:hypothetical protein
MIGSMPQATFAAQSPAAKWTWLETRTSVRLPAVRSDMRHHGVLGVALIAIVISSGGSAVGVETRPTSPDGRHADHLGARRVTSTVSDPEDVEACDFAPDCPIDIRAASKRPFTTVTGRRMLAFSVDAYQLHSGLIYIANIKLRLDTRGGPHSDASIFMALTDRGLGLGWVCGRRFETGGIVHHRYRLRVRGDRLTCTVPRRELHPVKRIRFQAISRANEFVVDRAPDQGWSRRSMT